MVFTKRLGQGTSWVTESRSRSERFCAHPCCTVPCTVGCDGGRQIFACWRITCIHTSCIVHSALAVNLGGIVHKLWSGTDSGPRFWSDAHLWCYRDWTTQHSEQVPWDLVTSYTLHRVASNEAHRSRDATMLPDPTWRVASGVGLTFDTIFHR